eukprot:1947129-Rhodomonas_salina.1
MVVRGPAGIGKTALLSKYLELHRQVLVSGITTRHHPLLGRSISIGKTALLSKYLELHRQRCAVLTYHVVQPMRCMVLTSRMALPGSA